MCYRQYGDHSIASTAHQDAAQTCPVPNSGCIGRICRGCDECQVESQRTTETHGQEAIREGAVATWVDNNGVRRPIPTFVDDGVRLPIPRTPSAAEFATMASRRREEAAQGVCVCVFMFLLVCVDSYCVLSRLDFLIWGPKACRLQLRICVDR